MSSTSTRFRAITTTERFEPAGARLGTAVVLGGSVAGLMAARVLSDHAERVLVIERDTFDAGFGPRRGVPQGSHIHLLRHAGRLQLERWFPGFAADAAAAGAPSEVVEANTYFDGVKLALPVNEPPALLMVTRPFLEGMIRDRVLARDNVRLVAGRATGLVFDGGQVVGATYVPADQDEEVRLPADFVVDATGRGSRAGDWLVAGGFDRPVTRQVDAKANYVTALVKRDKRIADVSWLAEARTRDAVPVRGAALMPVENDCWLLVTSSYDKDRIAPTREAFVERCRQFRPEFGDVAEHGDFIGDLAAYRYPDSRRHDFHTTRRLPARFVAAGDAVASFNPVHGQGMAAATLHASCLSAYLRSDPVPYGPARAYFDDVRVVTEGAWKFSTFNDLALPHVHGPYPRFYGVRRWYQAKVATAAVSDPVLADLFSRTQQMTESPSVFNRPRTVLKVLTAR
jgi:2-polyprenyl-6-methoxyphenol hydroxylase-like FAD-dependent oxidoreductase